MKTKKIVARILAVLLTLSMLVTVSACGINSYNTNPMVAKCGDVKLYLDQYLSLFNNTDTNSNMYYMYYMYGVLTIEDYREVMLEQLVNYGVQLNQAQEMGLTLDEDEEDQIQVNLSQQIEEALASYESQIDKTLTDKEEIRAAKMELLIAALRANGTDYDEYVEDLEESLRNSALIEKLRELTIADVVADNDSLQTYYDETLTTSTTVATFYDSFTKFFDGSEGSIPMYMPIPGVEDESESEDDASEDAEDDRFADIFSVMHCYIEFAETEEGEEPSFDKVNEEKVAEIEAALEAGTLTKESFLNDYCFNTAFGDDPGMWRDCYQFFGYMMHEDLISKYYDGFGYASMKLMYGDEWEIEDEEADTDTAEDESNEEESAEYELTFYDLADDENAVVKVMTDSGAHYITLNTNDCYNMYNEEGKLIVVMYDGESPVTDDEGIVTTAGHISDEELEAIDLTFSHAATAEDAEADSKEAEAIQKADDEDDAEPTADPEDAEPTAEPTAEPEDEEESDEEESDEGPYMTCKKLYDQYLNDTLSDLQSKKYNAEFEKWKEDTKIKTKPNVVSTLTLNTGAN